MESSVLISEKYNLTDIARYLLREYWANGADGNDYYEVGYNNSSIPSYDFYAYLVMYQAIYLAHDPQNPLFSEPIYKSKDFAYYIPALHDLDEAHTIFKSEIDFPTVDLPIDLYPLSCINTKISYDIKSNYLAPEGLRIFNELPTGAQITNDFIMLMTPEYIRQIFLSLFANGEYCGGNSSTILRSFFSMVIDEISYFDDVDQVVVFNKIYNFISKHPSVLVLSRGIIDEIFNQYCDLNISQVEELITATKALRLFLRPGRLGKYQASRITTFILFVLDVINERIVEMLK